MTPHVQTMDVHHLKKQYDLHPDLHLIDVRELHEWQDMHIPRAKHIPLGDLKARISTVIPNKTDPIYLHCRGGVRSKTAAQHLIQEGYLHVYSIDGGIHAWAEAHYPVITSG